MCTLLYFFGIILLQNGYTPLHLAVQSGLIPVVETLIRLEADITALTMVILQYLLYLLELCRRDTIIIWQKIKDKTLQIVPHCGII